MESSVILCWLIIKSACVLSLSSWHNCYIIIIRVHDWQCNSSVTELHQRIKRIKWQETKKCLVIQSTLQWISPVPTGPRLEVTEIKASYPHFMVIAHRLTLQGQDRISNKHDWRVKIYFTVRISIEESFPTVTSTSQAPKPNVQWKNEYLMAVQMLLNNFEYLEIFGCNLSTSIGHNKL